jgi:hypothetical protein
MKVFEILSLTHPNDEHIHETVNVCALKFRLSAVHHEFGFLTSKDHKAVTPLGVPQDTTTEKNLVIV